jgi:fatty acid desaturase
MLNIRILYFAKVLMHLVWPVLNKISFHFQVRNSEIVNVGILLVTGYWLLVTGYWLLDTGYWILVAGCWLLDTSYCLLPTARLRIFPSFL